MEEVVKGQDVDRLSGEAHANAAEAEPMLYDATGALTDGGAAIQTTSAAAAAAPVDPSKIRYDDDNTLIAREVYVPNDALDATKIIFTKLLGVPQVT